MGKQEEWLPLLEGLQNMTLDEAEGLLRFLVGVRLRIQTPQVFIHENGRPLAALVPIVDLAAVQALRKYPEIMKLLEEASGTTFVRLECSGGK